MGAIDANAPITFMKPGVSLLTFLAPAGCQLSAPMSAESMFHVELAFGESEGTSWLIFWRASRPVPE